MPYGCGAAKIGAETIKKISGIYEPQDIIDAHSHFGRDYFWKNEGKVDEYIKNAKENGIGATLAMSVPCPVIKEGDLTKALSYYELEGNEIKHYSLLTVDGKTTKVPHEFGIDPYKEANEKIYELTQKTHDIIFDYAPLMHPKYYSEEEILQHYRRNATAYKIHGVACGINPKEISDDFFQLLYFGTRNLIVHTDYSDKENILSYNSAKNWLDVLQKYDFKVLFTHAARLDDEAIKIINSDRRFFVGIGPDMLLGKPGQNYVDADDYLDYCFDKFDENKLIFDIDYPWNIKDKNDYQYDWGSANRIKSKLSNDKKIKVLKKNMIKFVNVGGY